MRSCDVLIVGGGPAGSSCARRLVARELDVVILDKRQFPRDKTCAGWVTPQVLDVLEVDRDDYAAGRILQPITGFRTGLMSGKEVHTVYGRTVSYGIRRCEFDTYLLERSGAELRLGESFKSLERVGDRWVLNGEIETPLLVGAGGHFCPVARSLGARENPQHSVVAAQEVEFEATPADLARGTVQPEEPELFFCDDLMGYAWVFRKGNFLNIGLGRVGAEHLTEHVGAFCQFLRNKGKVVCDIPIRFHGHAYQLYERAQPKLVDDGVVLIGDAAGLAYPQSGEGIRPAVESGLIAADVIADATGYSLSDLEPYVERLTARLGPPRGRSPSDYLPAGFLHFLASKLMANRWFARKVVVEDWFLHSAVPSLTAVPPHVAPARHPQLVGELHK